MKRKIVFIDQERCNGCGLCVKGCAEGALAVVDGKAKVVRELFCDGLGACLGHCPQGAITIVEREAEAFRPPFPEALHDPAVKRGDASLSSLSEEGGREFLDDAPCGKEPGNWPLQLQLIVPENPLWEGADLLVAGDCVAFASPLLLERLRKGKKLIVFCPKLDRSNDLYLEKLTTLFTLHRVRSVTTVHMEVPCCGGVLALVRKAISLSDARVPLTDITLAMDGGLSSTKETFEDKNK